MRATFLNCYKTCEQTIFQILFICYFCFYFTFTGYTNVLNICSFQGQKRKEKSNLKASLSAIEIFSFFQPPLLFQPPYPPTISFWVSCTKSVPKTFKRIDFQKSVKLIFPQLFLSFNTKILRLCCSPFPLQFCRIFLRYHLLNIHFRNYFLQK